MLQGEDNVAKEANDPGNGTDNYVTGMHGKSPRGGYRKCEKLEGITSIHVFLIPTRSAGIESGPGLGFDQVGKLHLQNRADPVEGVNGGIPLPALDLAEIGRGDLSVKGQVILRNP